MRQAHAQHIMCHLLLAMVAVTVVSCTTQADQSAKDSGGPYTQRTLGLWFRTTDDVTTRQVLWEEGGNDRGLSIYVDQGFVYVNGWNLPNDDIGATTPWGPSFVRTAINQNTFYHVALVLDQPAGEIRGFLDGDSFGEATAVGKLFDHPGDVNIGRGGDATVFHDGDTSAGHFLKGLVDEVELYNRALTASEIQAIFNAGSSGEVKPTPIPGLVSRWPGDGDANDVVGSNHGYFKRGATFAAGKVGQAFSLDANAYVVIPNSTDINLVVLENQDAFSRLFNEQCAVCHGENLLGAAQGTPLVGIDLIHGDSIANIRDSIAKGFPEKGMPAWSETLSTSQIRSLAIYVRERRLGLYHDLRVEASLELPQGTVESEVHDFRLETVIDSLDPLPYSIAPLPDGRILLTEKMRGLSIISKDGEQSDLIKGTPRTYDDAGSPAPDGIRWGLGWMMDVAIHPDYEKNGWIYIVYGDRCSYCNTISRRSYEPVSMNKLVRGRIKDGTWVDEETLWQADLETYSPAPDLAAGGRISFDHSGHVFISVGIKGADNHTGIQDLSMPYGKIYRMYDDGRVPPDNPFTGVAGAIPTIWTYGHRSPQGLEFNLQTGQLWGTEHGPRGGDEVNLLLPGRNYGWPLYSKGVNYDGTPVDYGKKLGIEFELKDIEQPVVDLTPSPAISSFIFYSGTAFPRWRNSIIVGSLKAASLYRMEIENNKVVHTETLLEDLARFRDIETGPSGEIYVLLENAKGGQIIRLVPSKRAGLN